MNINEKRPCKRCNGIGSIFHKGFSFEDKTYPDRTDVCYACDGEKEYSAPDFKAIVELVSKPGKNGRVFRKSKPAFENEHKNLDEGRAYFVWRMCRFHGGADVCMPVMADLAVSGDPFWEELNLFAEQLAKKVFGTGMAAAYRWANALGHSVSVPDSMPASAHACGPVADEHKPESEQPELGVEYPSQALFFK